jgi:hypothetical protein
VVVDLELSRSTAAVARSLASIGRHDVRIRVHAEQRLTEGGSNYRDAAPSIRVLKGFEIEPLPLPDYRTGAFWGRLVLRMAAFAALSGLYYFVVVIDLWNMLAPKTAQLPGGGFV